MIDYATVYVHFIFYTNISNIHLYIFRICVCARARVFTKVTIRNIYACNGGAA